MRRKSSIIAYIIAIAVLAATIPAGSFVFDRIMDSDLKVNALSSIISHILPDDIVSRILSGSLLPKKEEETEDYTAVLNADDLEGAENADPNILAETTPVSDSYFDDTLIIGDDMYDNLDTFALYPGNNLISMSSFTPSGFLIASFEDTATGEKSSITDIIADRAPARIYIATGYSGLDSSNRERYLVSWKTLINGLKTASPNSDIVIVSLPPIGISANSDTITNEVIRTVNGSLLNVARETDTYYLDIYSSLTNEKGLLSKDYDDGTGHINEAAYKKLIDTLKKHAVPTS